MLYRQKRAHNLISFNFCTKHAYSIGHVYSESCGPPMSQLRALCSQLPGLFVCVWRLAHVDQWDQWTTVVRELTGDLDWPIGCRESSELFIVNLLNRPSLVVLIDHVCASSPRALGRLAGSGEREGCEQRQAVRPKGAVAMVHRRPCHPVGGSLQRSCSSRQHPGNATEPAGRIRRGNKRRRRHRCPPRSRPATRDAQAACAPFRLHVLPPEGCRTRPGVAIMRSLTRSCVATTNCVDASEASIATRASCPRAGTASKSRYRCCMRDVVTSA